MKVLIAEDNRILRETLHVIVENSIENSQVFVCDNAVTGIQILKDHPDIKIILSDNYMESQ